MTDETAAPGAEPELPAESTTTPEIEQAPNTGAEQATLTEVKTETPETPEPPKKTPWFQKRIDQLTAEKWKERERAAALEATLAEVQKAQKQPGEAPQQPVDPASFQTAVEQAASRKLAEARFNEACNETYSKGASEFQDFDTTISNFRHLGGLPQDVLELTTQIENGHKVLYTLGKDLDEAARVLSLPPAQRAFELAKLSLQPDKPRPISSAPKPIKPIDGSHTPVVDLANASMEEFVRVRNKEEAERRRAGR
jgi:hypothetical protein